MYLVGVVMVTGVVLESVGCVVALGALSTPGAAGAANAAGTPDAVPVSGCKQDDRNRSQDGRTDELTSAERIDRRQAVRSSSSLSGRSRLTDGGQQACRGLRGDWFCMKAVLWQSSGSKYCFHGDLITG